MPTQPPAEAIIVPVGANVENASTAAGAGATLWLATGVHRLQSVTPLTGQTFIGADGAVLNGSRLLTSFTKEGANWVASGQTQQGQRNAEGHGEPGMPRASYPDAFYINDKPLQHVGSLGELGSGKYYFDYSADKIYFRDDPAGKKVEAAVSPFAFGGSASNVTIEGLTVEKYAAPIQNAAIFGQGDAWLVRDNEVRLNYGVGIDVADDGKIIGNFVHDNGEMGLAGGGDDILVQGNEIASNGYWSGYDVLWEGGGAKFTETDCLVVQNNFSHHNKGFGLWTDIDNINSLYEGNRVENNTLGGIFHEISYAAVIRNNTFAGNGQPGSPFLSGTAIRLANSQGVEVYGNTVDMTNGGNGIGLIQEDRGSGAFGTYLTRNNNIHDNIIINGNKGGAVGGFAGHNEAQMLAANNVFDRNEYRVTSAADEHWAWGDYMDWAGFRAAGQERNGKVSTFKGPVEPAPPHMPPPTQPPQPPAVETIVVDQSDRLRGSLGHQEWGDDVNVAAVSYTGNAVRVTQDAQGIGVAGGRGNNQIDYRINNGGQSETLRVVFDDPVKAATVRLGRLDLDENGETGPERGAWKAFAGQALVAQGTLDPRQGTPNGTDRYDFRIDPASDFDRLDFTAVAYPNGPKTGTESSDFSLYRVAFEVDTLV